VYSNVSNDKTPQSPPTHPASDSATRRACLRDDCLFAYATARCKKTDCCVEPPPPPPQDCPTDTDPLHRCTECEWLGTSGQWQTHRCARIKGAECYEIPSPRVAEHVIELLDLIELKPHDARRVLRHDDHSEVPITTVGVLRLLHRPLDQRTAAAVTAELAYIVGQAVSAQGSTSAGVAGAEAMAIQKNPDVDDATWAASNLQMRSGWQRAMRRHIADHHAASVTA
jgi:hypothetical protein